MEFRCIQLLCIWQLFQVGQATGANAAGHSSVTRETEHTPIGIRDTNTNPSVAADAEYREAAIERTYLTKNAETNRRLGAVYYYTNSVETVNHVVLNGSVRHDTKVDKHVSRKSEPASTIVVPPVQERSVYKCEVMLCEKDIGMYLVNTTVCSDDIPTINNAAFSSTVKIIRAANHWKDHTTLCQWIIANPINHYINLTVAQLADEFIGKFTMTISKVEPTDDLDVDRRVVDDVKLKNNVFSFVSLTSIQVRFESHEPHPSQDLTIQFEIREGSYMHENDEDTSKCRKADAVAVGTKCYTLVILERPLTWFDSQKRCVNRGERLATFKTSEEFDQFKEQMPAELHNQDTHVGAHLTQGLQAVSTESLYRSIWRWVDGTSVFSVQVFNKYKNLGACSIYFPISGFLNSCLCKAQKKAFVCESYKPSEVSFNTAVNVTDRNVFIDSTSAVWKVSVVRCSSGHITREFLSCSPHVDCDASYSLATCSAGGVTVPKFMCQRSRSTVHYTFVCDYKQHCSDNSDEDFCKYAACPPSSLKCRNGQCFDSSQWCDGKIDCSDGSEEQCRDWFVHHEKKLSAPGSIYLDGKGYFQLEKMNGSDECPSTHFQCPQSFCLPVFLLCNGIDDCPNSEDETGCDSYKCHGFYRCLRSKVCLHPANICDGILQCPEQDDELLCDVSSCPNECRCQGLAFVCSSNFFATSYLALRYLDASGSNMTVSDVSNNIHLIVLHLSRCRIISLPTNMTFQNLWELDLSWNELYRLHMRNFYSLDNLRILLLTGNPLTEITRYESPESIALILERVDLSYTNLEVFDGTLFGSHPHIKAINISWSCLRTISEIGFRFMPDLEELDLRGSHVINYPRDLLRNLHLLKTVYAENYKLCCEAMLPVHFELKNCHAPHDLLASCEDLLKSNSYRIFLWIFASLSLVGNMLSVGARFTFQQEGRGLSSFIVFVTNLCVADFFMGVYLAIIGTADFVYRGQYLWRDDEWKNGAACNLAGFLCLLSSEASAFIICLITLDRFLVLRFPFSRFHFDIKSALVACGIAWTVGISLSIVPLLPVTSHWKFYSQTGICIPLPFTSTEVFAGYNYSFSVSILLNFFLFLLIAMGQVVIYWAVRANTMPSSTNTRERDVAIARRLFTVALSDFLCWFPIGLLGLMASTGTHITGELNVAVAIFVLPINSALNPFLYTFNLVMERRTKARNEKLLKRLELQYRNRFK